MATYPVRACRVAVVLLCGACAVSDRNGDTDPAHAYSTGVETVRNTDDRWPRGELVRPAKRVFGSEADGPELFGVVPADDQVWDVFDAEGVFIGHVRLPSDVALLQVNGQAAVTRVSDDLGRVRVAIHDVRWIG